MIRIAAQDGILKKKKFPLPPKKFLFQEKRKRDIFKKRKKSPLQSHNYKQLRSKHPQEHYQRINCGIRYSLLVYW